MKALITPLLFACLVVLFPTLAMANNLETGLVAWWRMEDKVGNEIPDASGHGHTLTINGSPTFQTITQPYGTRQGDMVVFNMDGTLQAADDVIHGHLDLLDDWSISFWARLDGYPPGDDDDNRWINKHRAYHDAEGGWYVMSNDERLAAEVYGSPNYGYSVNEALTNGQWYRITTTFDTTTDTIRIYYDDQLKHETVGVPWTMLDNGYPVLIGGNFEEDMTARPYCKGAMVDIRLYDRVLSDVEVTELRVPEPATLGLLALGGLAMLRRRR